MIDSRRLTAGARIAADLPIASASRSIALSAWLCLSALALSALAPRPVAAAPAPGAAAAADSAAASAKDPARDGLMSKLYEAEKNLQYRTGEIKLRDGLAVIHLPDGYRYLDEVQAEKVLTRMWGNPEGGGTLGMILAPNVTPLMDDSWAVIIQYDEDGYVKDDDAEKIDYDDLLKDMQKSAQENNKERGKEGYDPIHIVGWAEKPHYDKAAHKLHWAKELRFGDAKENTLNYNIRILGRRGVLVLNAVSGMSSFETVKEGVKPILAAVDFQEGHRYSEFDPKLDKVATYGIGGLVAGGLLAKVGFFKLLLAGILALKKFIILGLLAVAAFFRRFFKGPSAQKEIKDVVREMPSQEKDSAKT
jgi:uncharacterized membrane-anchored protein